ncbi:hypothetical protein [Phenylobacterium aquaticum]|uniref:hypothetical protein n=1 Tax=Phenylobacterium aquaticum TaxID=1763816 RepID=UPI001F5D4D7A|nr:hypothetical protein [Phenylobacterium aquaticum]MCI3134589.1 hypothetical protein [Phenylobacterium aquaticum]
MSDLAPQLPALPKRQVLRLSSAYYLDAMQRIIALLDLGLGPALVFLEITWENFKSHPGVGLDAPEPVSIYAVAKALNVPYETTRRHITALVASQACERQTQGVVVAHGFYERPEVQAAMETTQGQTAGYVAALVLAGAAPAEPSPATQISRRVGLFAAEHLIRCARIARNALGLDSLSALVFLEIVRQNTWHLTQDPVQAARFASAEAIPPDDLRRGVSTYAVARSLRLPYETARRQVVKLNALGYLGRGSNAKHVVPMSVFASTANMSAIEDTWLEVERFLGALGQAHPNIFEP